MGLCKKSYAAFGSRIFFGRRLVFHDFASQNHEKQVSVQILFGAKRQEEPFYTTPYSLGGGCVKSLLPPSAAEYSFVRHIIFTISRSEIVKMMCLTKYNLARSAVKTLFTQPPLKYNLARSAMKILSHNLSLRQKKYKGTKVHLFFWGIRRLARG